MATEGKATKGAYDNDGNPVGRANNNPMLDAREYAVEFGDGTESELFEYDIAQSMYAQYDPDGNA